MPPTSSEPFGVDGYKTLAYELALDPQTANADTILISAARGDLLWGIYAGFKELVDEKFFHRTPRLVAVEPFPRLELALAGADYRGRFTGGSPLVSINGSTITYQAVAAVQRSGGTAVSVKPEDVIADQRSGQGRALSRIVGRRRADGPQNSPRPKNVPAAARRPDWNIPRLQGNTGLNGGVPTPPPPPPCSSRPCRTRCSIGRRAGYRPRRPAR